MNEPFKALTLLEIGFSKKKKNTIRDQLLSHHKIFEFLGNE